MIKHKSRLVIFITSGLLVFCVVRFPSHKHNLKIAAGKPNGDSFIFAKKMAEVVNKSENNIKISVLPSTPGTQENLKLLSQGKVQLATAQADIPAPPQAQLVSLLFPDMYQLILKRDSGNENILDLEGKRVALPPKGGGQRKSFDFLMKHYGLLNENLTKYYVEDEYESSKNKYQFYPVESSNPDDAFCKGKADVVFHVRRAGNNSMRKLLKNCNGKLIPIEQAGAMKIEYPDLDRATIPRGTYQGNPPIPDKDLKTISVNRLLLAHKDVDKEVIRKITTILYEHRQELVYNCRDTNFEKSQECENSKDLQQKMPAAALISRPNNLSGTGKPIHPGAKAYYQREDPSWFERYSGVMEVLLAVAFPFVSWSAILFRENIAKKNKADDYILEVTALMDAQECVKSVASFIEAHQSKETDLIEQMRPNIIKKAAKILLCTKKAQSAYSKRKISHESLKSFRKTLCRTVSFIEQIPESEEIFNAILQRARKNREKEQSKRLRNQLRFLIVDRVQYLGIKSPNQGQKPSQLEKDLTDIINQAKAKTKQQLKNLETSELLKLESQNIRKDLEAILKRGVNALVEERISQDSFQSFRVVWQIAVAEVAKDQ